MDFNPLKMRKNANLMISICFFLLAQANDKVNMTTKYKLLVPFLINRIGLVAKLDELRFKIATI